MLIFIIFILIQISFQDLPYLELPQFGEVHLKQQSVISLDLEGYNKDDEIYLEIVYKNSYIHILYTEEQFITSRTIDVWENNKLAFNEDTQQYITDYKYLKDNFDDFYFYYTVKLKSNYNKLYFITPKNPFEEYPDIDEFNPFREDIEVYVKHNKNNYNDFGTVEIIFISVITGVSIIGVIICLYIWRKIRRKKSYKEYEESPLISPAVAQN